MQLYRAVSQSELDDVSACGQFRADPAGFTFGKWFALWPEDAAAWGRRFAKWDGRRYYVVATTAPEEVALALSIVPNLDGIGAAVVLNDTQLLLLPTFALSPIPIGT